MTETDSIGLPRLDALPQDDERGTMGMILAIVTEAFLFAALFFAYYYLGHNQVRWPAEPPKLVLAFILLGILVTSSIVLLIAEKQAKRGAFVNARALVWTTIVLGIVFLIVQTFEYSDHLSKLRPTANAYAAIFYTTTSLHALHVVVGLCLLIFAAVQPELRPHRSPYRPLHVVALYWHFVDVVWFFIVGLLYLLPHWTRF